MTNTLGPNGSEVPLSRNLLYPFTINQLSTFQQQTIPLLAGVVNPRWRDEYVQAATAVTDKLEVVFTEKQIPCEFEEVEEVAFELVSKLGDSFMRIDCLLFSDGSPFIFDADIDDLEAPDDIPHYSILTTAEFPPFLALAVQIDGEVTSHNGDIRAYLDYLRSKNRSPHFLSEEAQQNIMKSLKLAELDPKMCLAANRNNPVLEEYLA